MIVSNFYVDKSEQSTKILVKYLIDLSYLSLLSVRTKQKTLTGKPKPQA